MHSGSCFEKVRDRITTRGDAFQLKNGTGIASMIRSVETDMQNDLATSHARRLAAGEDEVDELFEIAFPQAVHVGRIPVVDLSNAARERPNIRHLLRPWRPERVRQSSKVLLEDPVDRMNVVQDPHRDGNLLAGETIVIPGDDIVEAAIGPSLFGNEL